MRQSDHPNDAWLQQQEMRAAWEADEWRRLREQLARPVPPYGPAAPPPRPMHQGGSIILKGIVRFAIGAGGGYLGFLAAMDNGAGEFEVWLAVTAGFVIALSLSAFGYGRDIVVWIAEMMRWVILAGVACGAIWMIVRLAT